MTRGVGYARANRGFFAIGICGGKTPANLGTLFRHAMLYDASLVFTVGKRYVRQCSDTGDTASHIPLMHFADADDLIEHLPHGCPLVGVELTPDAIPLRSYTHPLRAAYLLGAEDRGLTRDQIAACHQIVQIESPQPWSMNVSVAGSLLMYDRHLQTARAFQQVSA